MPEGGCIIYGYPSDDFKFNDILLVIKDAFGSLSWIDHHGDMDNEYANKVHALPDGDIIFYY